MQGTRIGVDIGKVLIGGGGPNDTPFLGTTDAMAMDAPEVPGSFEGVAELVELTGGAVWLVSKCGSGIERRTQLWLEHHDFWDATGVPREHAVFCRERREKAPIARRLGLTHFVDDRADVLEPMAGVVEHRYLFGAAQSPEGLTATPSWEAVLREVRTTL